MRRFLLVAGLAMALLLAGAGAALGSHRRHHARHHASRHHRRTRHHRHARHHRRTRHHKRAVHHKRRRHRHHRRKTRGATITSAPTAAPAAGASGPCPSGPPGATASLGGHQYTLEGMDTFTKSAPMGSFAQSSASQIVYTGDHGMNWTGYPDGWSSTNSGSAEGYQPSTVLSVHDGMLDFHLHNDASGNPVGADPSPLPAGNQYQTYGAWSFCERVGNQLADFHQAPLLWPQNDSDWQSAESDYPESDLNSADFSGYSHYGGSGSQDAFDVPSAMSSFNPAQWHVYTQTWGPGFRSYFVDGRLVGTSTSAVWSQPERWQLQIEPSGANDGGSGDVYIKWVWIGAFSS